MTHTFPRYDDAAAFEVATNLFVYPAMLIAHRLGLFERLGEGPRTLDEIGAALGLARRPAEALVNASAALGFVRRDGDRFALTARARDLLLPASRQYFGAFWDLMYDNGDTFSIAGLEAALRAMRRTCTERRTSSIRIGGMRRSACASRARCRA